MNEEKRPLPCEVVRDLLPNYIDGLVSEETGKLIAAHLETCPDCKAAYDAMVAPDMEASLERATKADAEGVRYLKKIKRKHRVAIISVIAGLLAAFLLSYYFLAVYIYPFPTENVQIVERYELPDGGVYIKAHVVGDISAFAISAFSNAYVMNGGGNPAPEFPGNSQDMGFQFGYRMVDRLTQEATPQGYYFHFYVSGQVLRDNNTEAIYLCGWNSTDCLLLWKNGDLLPKPTDEELHYFEQYLLPNLGTGFYRTWD